MENNVWENQWKLSNVTIIHVLWLLIVNGANGQCGLHAPKVAIQGSKLGKEQLLNMKCLVVILVMENLLKDSNVIPIHVQSIVNGVNGVLGVNVPKAVMEEFKIDTAPNFKMLSLEGILVLANQVIQNPAMKFLVQER